jgi:hypothetical protein
MNPTKKTPTNFANQAPEDESNSTRIASHWSTFTKERAANLFIKTSKDIKTQKESPSALKIDQNESG